MSGADYVSLITLDDSLAAHGVPRCTRTRGMRRTASTPIQARSR